VPWVRSSRSSRARDQLSGNGIMVFFNDPAPGADPDERAVKMALAMREAASKLDSDLAASA
jgi:class 3 adenylate cyclase